MNVPRPPSDTHRRTATGVDRQASAVSNDFLGQAVFAGKREARLLTVGPISSMTQ